MSADMFAQGPAWLFCPADRPDRYAKAAAAADVVIIDLEDGVPGSRRVHARACLREAGGALDPHSTVLRINPAGTSEHDADLELLTDLPVRAVMLAKAEHPDQLTTLPGMQVIALCETPRGVVNAGAIAGAANCGGLMWGCRRPRRRDRRDLEQAYGRRLPRRRRARTFRRAAGGRGSRQARPRRGGPRHRRRSGPDRGGC
jgi:HpcH/HpaI aldolase/citrate lyase family